jgi:glycosyltransferase involved in cell wall biosynthesis
MSSESPDLRAASRCRVLLVASYVPWPLDRGDPMRVFGLSSEIAKHFQPELFSVRRPEGGETEGLRVAFPTPVRLFPSSSAPLPRIMRKAWPWIAGIATLLPPAIVDRRSNRMAAELRRVAPTFDVVVLFGERAGVYASAVRASTLVVWDKSNVLGASALDDHPSQPIRRRLVVWLSRRFERRVLSQVDWTIVTSQPEAERLSEIYGRPPNEIVPSGVPVPDSADVERRPNVVGWMGQFRYRPNAEGLKRFLVEGWPACAARGLVLELAGPDSPDDELRLIIEQSQNVRMLGFVEDLNPWLRSLGSGVVPLWTGAGVKVKSLSFLAAAVPVVGTGCAAEGIVREDATPILLSEEPAGLANHLVDLAGDVKRASLRGADGRNLVMEKYSWEAVGGLYVTSIERAMLTVGGKP